MSRPLTVLTPTRYPGVFNCPRGGRHQLVRTPFVPLNKVSSRLQGIMLYPPQRHRYDLIHAINRIPLVRKPFVITFESHLPRVFSHEGGMIDRMLRARLASDDCRTIIAKSTWARGMFLDQHRDNPELPMFLGKLRVVYPNVVAAADPRLDPVPGRKGLKLVFVGNHFARKGGVVAVRLARLAHERGLPIEVEIVSKLECGGGIWTDPPDASLFARDLELLALPNVRFHQGLPNGEVMRLLKDADFSLLPTLSDTFGFSVIEGFSVGTPAIVTSLNALPEMVTDGLSGIVLPLPADPNNEWLHLGRRLEPGYGSILNDTYDELAGAMLARLEPLLGDLEMLAKLRRGCYQTVLQRFDADRANALFDRLYEEAMEGPIIEPRTAPAPSAVA